MPHLRAVTPDEIERFWLWELASTVEGALGELIDPDALSVAEARGWCERVGWPSTVYRYDERFSSQYWLLGEQGIVGTVGAGNFPRGGGALPVESLYVRPGDRRAGHATRALETMYLSAVAEGLGGICLETNWSWQPAVQYYLNRGMWLWNWKHSLAFVRLTQLPRWELVRSADALTFCVERSSGLLPLLTARRNGSRLVLTEAPLYNRLKSKDSRWMLLHNARATLALCAAVEGRPLVRSDAAWDEASRYADCGEPEGLAYKIQIFERVARDNGWRVTTPVIPGIPSYVD